jgi:hypothetical protein
MTTAARSEINYIKQLWDDYHGQEREKALAIIEALRSCTPNVSKEPSRASYILAKEPCEIRLTFSIMNRRPCLPALTAEIPGTYMVYVNIGRNQKAAALWFALRLPPFNRNP